MEYTIKNAEQVIVKNKEKVNGRYRQKFHMMPPCGWMNDPNGLVKFHNQYHLFYQYYPYSSEWGPMHWGHFVSEDLIRYEDAPVALAPDAPMESGCFSGGAIADGEQLKLFYTRHYTKDKFQSQTQYVASSFDGLCFEKSGRPVFDNESLPENISRADFRDPNPVEIDGSYYLFLGGKTDKDEGIIVVLKGRDLMHFEYDFSIGPIYEFGEMGECPSYFRIDDMDCFVASGVNVKPRANDYKNVTHASVFIAGKIDFAQKKMDITHVQEIDKGDTYYAPQMIANEREPIAIGWLEMWEKKYPTALWGHGWIGCFAIPRVIRFENGCFFQRPVDSIQKYYKRSFRYNGEPISRFSDLTAEISGHFKLCFRASNGSFTIGQDAEGIYLDGRAANNLNNTFRRTNGFYENTNIRILLDNSSVEIFVDGGREAISSRIYLDSDYTLEVEGAAGNILVNEIEVESYE